MKRFTKSLMALALLIGGATTANASYQIGTKYTSVASLSGHVFAIAQETAGKAFYGPTGGYGHEVGFDAYATAFSDNVNFYYFKLVDIPADKIAEDPSLADYTLIRACKADGSFYTFWGDSENGYLNANTYCIFLLGKTAKNLGQDYDYGAVWKVEYVDGKGFTIQNKYTGDKYLNDAGSPNYDEPTYFTFAEVEEVPEDEPLYDKTIPDGYVNLISNGDLEGSGLGNFAVNDWPSGEVKHDVRVVEDPSDASNHVIVVTSNDAATQDYESQVFFTLPESQHFNVGDKVRLRMRIKAVNKQSGASSQFHNAPGAYVFWNGVGSLNFKEKWSNFDSGEVTVSASQYNDNGAGPSRTIAFNLSDVDGGSSNTFYFDEIQLLVNRAPKEFSVTTAEWGTYSFDNPVSFGGDVKAYPATYDAGVVTLHPVTTLAVNTGVIVNADAGDYNASVIPDASVVAEENDLKVSNGSVTGNGTIFALGKKNGVVGFAKVKTDVAVPAGKAYLVIPAAGREFLGFGEDATGVETLKQEVKAGNQYFNLAGQRVAQPTKGLYIVNGKKVIVK